jgi:uncharacterized protein (TIGR03382 family)
MRRGGAVLLIVATFACGRLDRGNSTRLEQALGSGLVVSPAFPLDSPAIDIRFYGGGGYASIGAGDGQYLVTTKRASCLESTRVRADGVVLDPGGFCLTNSGGGYAATTWDGQSWLVVWQEQNIGAARIRGDGAVVDSSPVLVASNSADGMVPGLAFNGSDHLAVWSAAAQDPEIHARIVPLDGGDPPTLILTDAGRWPAVASDGVDFFVVWHECCGLPAPRLLGARVTSGGTVSTTPPLYTGQIVARPAMTWSGTHYVVTWAQPGRQLFAQRIAADGSLLDSTPIALGTTGVEPSVAFDGTVTTVVAADTSGSLSGACNAAQLNADGTIAGAGSIRSILYGSCGGAAALADQSMVVVTDELLDNGSYAGPVNLVLPLRNSPPLSAGPSTVVQLRQNSETAPALARSSREVLAAWTDDRGPEKTSPPRTRLFAVMFDPSAAAPLGAVFPITDGGANPRVASDGDGFMLAWQLGTDVIAGAVHADGGFAYAPGVRIGAGTVGDLVFFQNQFILLWFSSAGPLRATAMHPDGTLVATSTFVQSPGGRREVRAAAERDAVILVWAQGVIPAIRGFRVQPDGGTGPDGGFVLAPSDAGQVSPWVASDGVGALVVWQEGVGPQPRIAGALEQPDAGWARIAPIPVTLPDAGQTKPQVFYDGTRYVVSWSESNTLAQSVLLTRIAGDGTLVDDPPILILDAGAGSTALGALSQGRSVLFDSTRDSRFRVDRLYGRFLGDPDALDAGSVDAGSFDAGSADAGSFDAGVTDSGSISDSGTADSGSPIDSGAIDSGSVDGGSVDGGSVDGGLLDAGQRDAGHGRRPHASGDIPVEPWHDRKPERCGCADVPGIQLLGLAALGALGARRKRTP